MVFSLFMVTSSFVPSSFGFGDYDYLSEIGSFGIVKPGHFSHPQHVAVGDDGSIYVTDLGNKRIQKFSSTGEYVAEWGKSGKQAGEFHYPSGITVADGAVFVADRDLNRIQKFTTDGEFVAEWGKRGSYEGQFLFPNGVAVYDGIVYVVDTGNQRIQQFTTDGDFVSSFGSSGLGPGQFLTVVGIDIDDNGNIFVTDKGNSKIEKFSSDGVLLKSFPFHYSNYNFSPEAIAIDPEGKMFVVNSAYDTILHLSQDSDLRLSVFDQLGPYSDYSFDVVTDVDFGLNGELLIVDSANHKIQYFETEFYTVPVLEYYEDIEVIEVVVKDQIRPVIVAPESLVVDATDMLSVVSIGEATATDASGISTIMNNAPDLYPIGVTTVTWIAFDNVGLTSNTIQTVYVKACGNDSSFYNVIKGTPGNDVLHGTPENDLIFGLAGDDLISGGDGDDCIFGGDGKDIISGGSGDDNIKGNAGNDILKGETGVDVIYGNSGYDVIDGGEHSDRCYVSEHGYDVTTLCES